MRTAGVSLIGAGHEHRRLRMLAGAVPQEARADLSREQRMGRVGAGHETCVGGVVVREGRHEAVDDIGRGPDQCEPREPTVAADEMHDALRDRSRSGP